MVGGRQTFATKASLPPFGVGSYEPAVAGKLVPDEVDPVMKTQPFASRAMPSPRSELVPPRRVDCSSVVPVKSRREMKTSLVPPKNATSAGKSAERVVPTTCTTPESSATMSRDSSPSVPPRYVA